MLTRNVKIPDKIANSCIDKFMNLSIYIDFVLQTHTRMG